MISVNAPLILAITWCVITDEIEIKHSEFYFIQNEQQIGLLLESGSTTFSNWKYQTHLAVLVIFGTVLCSWCSESINTGLNIFCVDNIAGGGNSVGAAVGGRARLGVRLALRALVRGVQRGAAAHGRHGRARVAGRALRPAARARAGGAGAAGAGALPRAAGGRAGQRAGAQRLGLARLARPARQRRRPHRARHVRRSSSTDWNMIIDILKLYK